jgi:vacuolar-type H+-ATPase subunit H
MNKEKLLQLLNSVGCVRTDSVPLITHLLHDFKMNWVTAKRWHEILEAIPMAEVSIEKGIPSAKVSKHSPVKEHRVQAKGMEEFSDEVENSSSNEKLLADGTIRTAKIRGKVVSVRDIITGYGEVTKIRKNQFGDYLISFVLEDGSEYEVSEFHLNF